MEDKAVPFVARLVDVRVADTAKVDVEEDVVRAGLTVFKGNGAAADVAECTA